MVPTLKSIIILHDELTESLRVFLCEAWDIDLYGKIGRIQKYWVAEEKPQFEFFFNRHPDLPGSTYLGGEKYE